MAFTAFFCARLIIISLEKKSVNKMKCQQNFLIDYNQLIIHVWIFHSNRTKNLEMSDKITISLVSKSSVSLPHRLGAV
jgi:hypothetical protein